METFFSKPVFRVVCIAALMASAAFVSPAQADQLSIAEGGTSSYVIEIPAQGSPCEGFAASELQRYIEKMSGARLRVVNENEHKNERVISVGLTARAKAAEMGLAPRYPEDDAYGIRSFGSTICLVGCRPRGTLYAVYDFLDRLGCRWFAPGYRFYKGMHELVPKKPGLAVETPLDVVETPDFKFRCEFPEHSFMHEPDDVVALIDWCSKNRINTISIRLNELSGPWYRILEPECTRRDLRFIADAHGFERFLSRTEYFQDHPDWFGPFRGENSDRYFDQFNVSHPEAVETFTKNLREFVRDYPTLYAVSAMPNDSPRWTDDDTTKLSTVEKLFAMYDLVVRTVYEANPAMKVHIGTGVTYFGQDGTEVYRPPYPNVLWHTAVLRRTQKYAWNDPKSELNWSQYEKAAAVTKRIAAEGGDVVWDSRYCPFRDISLPGLVYPHQMSAELQDLKKIGGAGVNFNYAVPPAWIPYELKHHIFTRLVWDTSQDVEQIMSRYYRERFPGSPDEMRGFYTALRRAMERYDHPGGGYTREQAHGLYPEDEFATGLKDIEEAQRFLDKAMAVNSNDAEKQIIWLLGASLRHGRNKMELDRLAQAGRIDEAREKVAEMMDYLEAWDGKGINYDSSFLRMRLECRFDRPKGPIKKALVTDFRVYEFKDYGPDGTRKDGPR